MIRFCCISLLLGFLCGFCFSAEPGAPAKEPHWLLPMPGLDADPAIPTLERLLGYAWAREITTHAEIERYLEALAKAAPDRVKLVRYGDTYERRGLFYLVITSTANLKRLEEIRKDNLRLADPRKIAAEPAASLAKTAPAVVWLTGSIHGDECSSSDALLLAAYHLLADRRASTQRWLEQLVVIIDPLQNPDGRERFLQSFRKSRGEFIQSHPLASEHMQPWPGGRSNHYYFDMNRDWFLQSQRETQARVKAYLQWQPQIFADAHEMGRSSHYFFDPPTDPIIPYLLPHQRDWLFRIGRHQAQRFDEFGFRYTTREMFDAFYPGYGSEWPTLQGGLGILWEQASVRGLVVDRDDETKLYYHDSVRHHYVSAIATLEVAAEMRESLLRDSHEAQRRSVQLGREGPIRHYFLLEGSDPHRAASLAQLLVRNGIEVGRLGSSLRLKAKDIREEVLKDRVVPSGSYHVPVAQPGGRLVRALLDRHVDMDERFVKEQLRRNELFMPDEIYDVTSWSLPLAFRVPCWESESQVDVAAQPYQGELPAAKFPNERPRVAYLVPGTDGGTLALCDWLQAGLRVHVTDRRMKLNGTAFDPGTLVLFVHDNSDKLQALVREAANRYGLSVQLANTGFVEEGAHLGGPYIQWVRPPRIIMPLDRPTSYGAGHTWHLFDQRLRYPTTRVAAQDLPSVDLDDFNVLVLPDGSYSERNGFDDGFVQQVKRWIGQGGTLILVQGAARWALGEKIGLLATTRLQRPIAAIETSGTKQQPDSTAKPTMVAPDSAPGVFLRASVFGEHWVTYGCHPEMEIFFSGDLILKPLVPSTGRNLVTFAKQDKLLASGFCWPKTLELLAETPYVIYQAVGTGHVVAFTDDPNFRAMYPSLQRLFVNAVLFGPGH